MQPLWSGRKGLPSGCVLAELDDGPEVLGVVLDGVSPLLE